MAKRTFRAADLRVSATSTSWAGQTSLDADLYSISVGGGDRNVGECFVAAQDYPEMGAGKRTAENITVNCIFDDTAAHAYQTVRPIYETAGGAIFVRWAAQGSVSGAYGHEILNGICTSCPPPEGDVESGDCIGFSFGVTAAKIDTMTL